MHGNNYCSVTQLFLVVCTAGFLFFTKLCLSQSSFWAGHRHKIQAMSSLYLIYNNVITFCVGSKLGVFIYDLQRSGHHVLCLLCAA